MGARSVPHPLGRSVTHAGHPAYWSLNELQVAAPAPAGLDAAAIIGAADAVQRGLAHRRVFVDDDAAGARVAPELGRRGWRCTRDVYMVLRRPRDRGPDAAARETGLDTLLAAKRPVTAGTVGDHKSAAIAGGAAQLASCGRARHYVADFDGRPAAYATLYSDGSTAQVEDVATQPAARGRGLARGLVSRAVDVALAEGHEMVFLVADADDWPRELYAKLGFDPAGYCWAFVRPPG